MSNEPKAGKGIDPEMLAAYIDNRLPPEQRAAVEAQLATDPESYALLVDTLEALEDDEIKALEVREPLKQPIPFAPKQSKSRVRKLMIAGGALAAAAAIVLAVMRPELLERYLGGGADPRFERLVAAVGEERYIESRLTGGFAFGPLRSASRADRQLGQENLALLAAAGELQKLAQSNPTAENLHRWGVAQLLLGQLASGAETLEASAALDPNSAAVLADLAAAHLELARTGSSDSSWTEALEYSERALSLNPGLDEARFSRALAIEGLGLPAARQAWEDYLANDPGSPWSVEAQSHLRRLPEAGPRSQRRRYERELATSSDPAVIAAAVSADPQRAREMLEEEFAAAISRERIGGGSSELRRALIIAESYEKVSSDRLPRTLLRGLRSASLAELRPISVATNAFAEAANLVRLDRQAEAETLLVQASRQLKPDHPLMGWIRYYQAQRLAQLGQLTESVEMLRALLPTAKTREFFSLAGTIHGRIGQVLSRQGDMENAISERIAAIAMFRKAADFDQVAVMERMIAEAYYLLGDFPAMWTHQLRALRMLPNAQNYRSRHMVLLLAGVGASTSGHHFAAAMIHREVVANGEEWQRGSGIAEGYLLLSQALFRSGQETEAARELLRAEEFIRSIPDPQFRQRIELELLEIKGELTAESDRSGSVGVLSSAIERARAAAYPVRMANLLRVRGRVLDAQGDAARAEDDWRQARLHLEDERMRLSDQQLRLQQAGALRGLLSDTAVARFERRETAARSLEPVEDSRARTLVEQALGGSVGVATPEAIQRSTPNGTYLLYYLVTPRRSIAWVVGQNKLVAADLQFTSVELAAITQRYRRAVSGFGGPAEFRAANERLSEMLLSPVWDEIADAETVVVVADPTLQGISFTALLEPGGGFLVQRMAVAKAPSGTLVIQQPTPPHSDRVVLIAADNPPNAKPLPWANVEITQVAALYPNSVVLKGADAIRDQLLRQLTGARLVHFAGHSVASASSPLLSRLLLNADATGRSAFYSYELSDVELPSAVVILSACHSGFTGTSADDDGTLAMARPFLARGAKAVLATAWDVSDRESSTAMESLHAKLRDSMPIADAWRAAALTAIERSRSPIEWGAYAVLIGRGGLSELDSKH